MTAKWDAAGVMAKKAVNVLVMKEAMMKCQGCGISIPEPGEYPDPDAMLCDYCYDATDNIGPTQRAHHAAARLSECCTTSPEADKRRAILHKAINQIARIEGES